MPLYESHEACKLASFPPAGCGHLGHPAAGLHSQRLALVSAPQRVLVHDGRHYMSDWAPDAHHSK